jgi:hypothetical protein
MNRWNSANSNLSPERIEALRRKIEAGEYNSTEAAETVARRILARGDLRGEFRDQRGGDRSVPSRRISIRAEPVMLEPPIACRSPNGGRFVVMGQQPTRPTLADVRRPPGLARNPARPPS